MSQFTVHDEVVEVSGGRLRLRVKVAGSGPPLVYLHAAAGLSWDGLLDALSRSHTVYAPEHPGTSRDDPDAIHRVDSWLDLLLAYEELFAALGLQRPVVIGSSYGGMLAADLAATFPAAVGRLIVLDAIGLWRDDAPVRLVEMCTTSPADLPAFLFHDPDGPAARASVQAPEDPDEAIAAAAARTWALGCTGKFFWPIADHGLGRRLHRVTAPTLVLWGAHDALVPAVYADEFGRLIPHSQVMVIADAGHVPQAEQPAVTLSAIEKFLKVSSTSD